MNFRLKSENCFSIALFFVVFFMKYEIRRYEPIIIKIVQQIIRAMEGEIKFPIHELKNNDRPTTTAHDRQTYMAFGREILILSAP